MKKVISFVLAAVLALSMVACGGGEDNANKIVIVERYLLL